MLLGIYSPVKIQTPQQITREERTAIDSTAHNKGTFCNLNVDFPEEETEIKRKDNKNIEMKRGGW